MMPFDVKPLETEMKILNDDKNKKELEELSKIKSKFDKFRKTINF